MSMNRPQRDGVQSLKTYAASACAATRRRGPLAAVSPWRARRSCASSVITTTRVPTPMWGGTMVLTPLLRIAVLNEDEAVWPFTTGSVSVISRVTRAGSSIDERVALEGLHEDLHAVLQERLLVADDVFRARRSARRWWAP